MSTRYDNHQSIRSPLRADQRVYGYIQQRHKLKILKSPKADKIYSNNPTVAEPGLENFNSTCFGKYGGYRSINFIETK